MKKIHWMRLKKKIFRTPPSFLFLGALLILSGVVFYGYESYIFNAKNQGAQVGGVADPEKGSLVSYNCGASNAKQVGPIKGYVCIERKSDGDYADNSYYPQICLVKPAGWFQFKQKFCTPAVLQLDKKTDDGIRCPHSVQGEESGQQVYDYMIPFDSFLSDYRVYKGDKSRTWDQFIKQVFNRGEYLLEVYHLGTVQKLQDESGHSEASPAKCTTTTTGQTTTPIQPNTPVASMTSEQRLTLKKQLYETVLDLKEIPDGIQIEDVGSGTDITSTFIIPSFTDYYTHFDTMFPGLFKDIVPVNPKMTYSCSDKKLAIDFQTGFELDASKFDDNPQIPGHVTGYRMNNYQICREGTFVSDYTKGGVQYKKGQIYSKCIDGTSPDGLSLVQDPGLTYTNSTSPYPNYVNHSYFRTYYNPTISYPNSGDGFDGNDIRMAFGNRVKITAINTFFPSNPLSTDGGRSRSLLLSLDCEPLTMSLGISTYTKGVTTNMPVVVNKNGIIYNLSNRDFGFSIPLVAVPVREVSGGFLYNLSINPKNLPLLKVSGTYYITATRSGNASVSVPINIAVPLTLSLSNSTYTRGLTTNILARTNGTGLTFTLKNSSGFSVPLIAAPVTATTYNYQLSLPEDIRNIIAPGIYQVVVQRGEENKVTQNLTIVVPIR